MRKTLIVATAFVALAGLAVSTQAQQTPAQKPKMPPVATLKRATPGVPQCIVGRLSTQRCDDGNCICNTGEWFAGGDCILGAVCFYLCNSLADCVAPTQNP
jgi:hypothetical protein